MKIKKRASCKDVCGEPYEFCYSVLKKMYLDKSEAEYLCLLICNHDKLPVHIVTYIDRKTKGTMATYNGKEKTIRINKGYNTVHTILHEMAHNVSYYHKKNWLECFKKYIDLWETRWNLYFERKV